MGGQPKGLLRIRELTLIGRWCDVLGRLGLSPVLIGRHEAYAELGLTLIADDPPGIGPLGGIVALLRTAGDATVLALACDMPHVTGALVERLLAAPEATVVAPRIGEKWEPLCARYDAPRVLLIARAGGEREARVTGVARRLQRATPHRRARGGSALSRRGLPRGRTA